ncbi:farnesyl pyrophosphate synthetase, putative [Eimeria praecox]|uniref:Farnesyl pyrophosphate synthetase, putative n=1 Tax=Eimeria praecox TaxID=51316 RepID=U6H534_9EIME|nr:farnesyl pyrophosphate synthetase, putative [Eimeria praecox]
MAAPAALERLWAMPVLVGCANVALYYTFQLKTPSAASAAAAAESPQASALLRPLSAPARGPLAHTHTDAFRGVIRSWGPCHSGFPRGLHTQATATPATVTAATRAATAATTASEGPVRTNGDLSGGNRGLAASPQAAGAACFEPGVGVVQVNIKRDQQRFLQMLSPLREALLARISACAPQEEAKAFKNYYSRVIDYNCTGGKLLRGLLTVYASLAASREVEFVQPSESAAAPSSGGAAAAAAPDPAAAPSVFRLATAPSGAAAGCCPTTPSADAGATAAGPATTPAGAAAAVSAGAAAAGAAAIEEAFNSGACALGWGVELLQAAFLVADDQMDGADTRRGKEVAVLVLLLILLLYALIAAAVAAAAAGVAAAADAAQEVAVLVLLLILLLRVIRSSNSNSISSGMNCCACCGKEPQQQHSVCTLLQPCHQDQQQQQHQQRHELLRVLREGTAAATTTLQQLTAAARSRQQAAARLKTSYYSFWLPTALGLLYSGVSERSILAKAEEICLCTGDYFQAQDDFLDCFGCPDSLGKSGTDIREGKCSWLLAESPPGVCTCGNAPHSPVGCTHTLMQPPLATELGAGAGPLLQALAAATPAQAADLLEAYGRPEGEKTVRELYIHLKVQERFKDYENGAHEKILRLVEGLKHPGLHSYFVALLQLLHRRPQ